jgi:formylglycine-generating enzyme required for sulfatase activity/serine/threonine protein kinase
MPDRRDPHERTWSTHALAPYDPTDPTRVVPVQTEAPTALYVPLPDDVTARTIQGRYRLVARLGMGGMGVTYRAWDVSQGVPVVIKMPRTDVRNAAEIKDRFMREVRAMLVLSHEHIVPITDHGEEDGCPFVAMRFLSGGSLAEYRGKDELGEPTALSPSTLHFWLPGIASALDFIHSSGVLHRDVKPGNIFLDGFLKPFLGDFGLVKVVEETAGLDRDQTLTGARAMVGTPEYMAPELLKPGAVPDGRVDQYALAVTVYEMLAGRKPFRGEAAHIIVEHASKAPPSLRELCPDVPRHLAEAVHRALAKDRAERFPTCGEFADAVLAGAPPLKIDTSRARLLCPRCRAILRVPMTTAGKQGTCPRCRSSIAVAEDLGSLWLAGEDRSSATLADEIVFVAEESVAGQKTSRTRSRAAVGRGWSWPATHWAAVGGALMIGMAIGHVATKDPRPAVAPPEQQPTVDEIAAVKKSVQAQLEQLTQRHAAVVDGLRGELEAAKTALGSAEGQIAGLQQRRTQDADERDALAAENRRLSEALAQAAKAAEKKPAADPPRPEFVETITNSIGMKLRLIPAGTFSMGDGDADGPPHVVTITKPFYLGVCEVTNAEWKNVMRKVPGRSKDDDLPVSSVSWDDAMKFCWMLTTLPEERDAGRVYRLPTEAEWEYACRAGTTTTFSFGDDESLLEDYGWFRGNAANESHPVGAKKPNPWGLHDMHGNVWEWCNDFFSRDAVASGPATDPQGPDDGSSRVRRGGGWKYTAATCKSSQRTGSGPSNRDDAIGFRVAMSPSGAMPTTTGK